MRRTKRPTIRSVLERLHPFLLIVAAGWYNAEVCLAATKTTSSAVTVKRSSGMAGQVDVSVKYAGLNGAASRLAEVRLQRNDRVLNINAVDLGGQTDLVLVIAPDAKLKMSSPELALQSISIKVDQSRPGNNGTLSIYIRRIRTSTLDLGGARRDAREFSGRINVKIEEGAVISVVNIGDVDLGEVSLYVDGRDPAASVSIVDASFERIVVAGSKTIGSNGKVMTQGNAGLSYFTIDAIPVVRPDDRSQYGNAPSIELTALDILQGQISLKPARNMGVAAESCSPVSNRFVLRLQRIGIGTGAGEKPTPSGLLGGQGALRVRASEIPCTELYLDDISLAGTLDGLFGELSKFVLGKVKEDKDSDVSALDIRASRLHRIWLGSVSLTNLALSVSQVSSSSSIERAEVDHFGFVRISRTARLPTPLLDEVTKQLSSSSSLPFADKVAIRQFLRDIRPMGFYSDTQQPVAKDVLFHILVLDSETYFNKPFTNILKWLTGFGIHLEYPFISFFIICVVFFVIVSIIWAVDEVGGSFPIGMYPLRYLGIISGWDKSFDQMSPWVRLLVYLHRLLIVLQITVVGLFIQNAVLAAL